MTDNEIKLALPFLAKYCKDEYNDIRVDEVLLGASDLINRKEAEIERLETEYESVYEQAKADILGNMADGGTSCHWCIEQHKAEAIKECLNKVAVFCAESGLFQCEADEMLLFNYLDSLKMKAMLKANGMVGETE